MQKGEKSFLASISKFENDPLVTVDLAHIHLLPALCHSKIIPLAWLSQPVLTKIQ